MAFNGACVRIPFATYEDCFPHDTVTLGCTAIPPRYPAVAGALVDKYKLFGLIVEAHVVHVCGADILILLHCPSVNLLEYQALQGAINRVLPFSVCSPSHLRCAK